MSILKQSTAATIKLGPFVDDTDGKTAETALTIGQADIRLSKNGGDIAQTHNSAGATHDELGYYDIPLDTTDTGTLGRLRVLVSKAGALPVWQDFLIVTANVYDSMFSTDKLDVAVVEMATDVLTAAAVKADAVTKIQNGLATPTNITAGTITTVTNLTNLPTMPTDWVTAAGLKADAVTEIQDGVTLANTQPAITWGRQKIIADVVGEGALHIVNTNGNGFGQKNIGGAAGVVNEGDAAVVNNGAGYGMYNVGNDAGMYNSGNAAGMYNSGNAAGMHNYSASTGGAGMKNEAQGASGIGVRNIGTSRNVVGYDPDQATEATLAAIKAKTDNLPASPAAVGSAMTLTAAYDKAKDDVLTPLGVVDGIVDAIKAQTDKIPATPASSGEYTSALTAIQNDLDNPNQYKADVSNLALEATLTAIKGAGWMDETLVALKTAIDNVTGGGATAQQIWEYATRTLSAATNLPSAADISDAVWNEATTDHTTAGSTGVALTDILTDTSTTLDNKLDIIDVVADTIYAEMGSSAEVADVVWDELLAGHVIGGSAGEKIAAIKAKTDLMNASAITYTPTVSGTTITLRRGDTLSAPLTNTGALTGYVSIDFTVKRRMSDLDDDAIIRIRKNASGTNDGLLRLNAAAPTSSALGSIIVNDVTTGDITITLDETATDDLDTGGYLYDVQLIDADSVLTLTYGKLSVVADVTRAVS